MPHGPVMGQLTGDQIMKFFNPEPAICTALLLSSFCCHASGLTLGATRLIYSEGAKEATVPLSNGSEKVPYLIQSWVSDLDGKSENIPFITTPPVFKLLQNKVTAVRVVNVSDVAQPLPQDKESVWLLNVRAIPAVEKQANPARMTVSTQNIIKLIYRPKGLTAKAAGNAWSQQQVSKGSGFITVTNPTPYVVTLTRMNINGENIDKPGLVMPFATKRIETSVKNPSAISFSIIDDYGGISPKKNINL
ncbi:fimbrial chaperone protein [Erwinia mallotivora]|uniref:Fimbrial chaperone protein n=2 Tax=Erwinia mallotivora TaxID=69222 RepID=A0A014PUF3_9GAMM|nr:fimbrial chaperone protein [Erwinia mallotivora]